MNGNENAPALRFAGELTRRQFVAMVGLFWLYVMLSNVLYAYSMRTGIGHMTDVPLFAPWQARVLQHLLLLPCLLVSYWASLRIEWRPLLVAIPLQAVLATVFAALAYPAMMIGEVAYGGWSHEHKTMAQLLDLEPGFFSLWLASFVTFLPAYGFGLALLTGVALYTRFREFRAASARRSSASGARRAWRRCACNCRRIRCSICCTPSAATSNGTRRARRRWSCSSRICCAGC